MNARIKKYAWVKVDNSLPVVDKEFYIDLPAGSDVCTDELMALIVDTYAVTGNKSMACRQAGIDEKTLRNWCSETPGLSLTLASAREAHLIGQYKKIANAKDWKAAKEILARAPETKEQWGEIQEKGPQVILNIHRDEVIIEQ